MAVPHFDPASLTNAANDTFTVRRVFGEAYERNGTLVIPVARLWGGTGSGSGGGEAGVPSAAAEGETTRAGARRATAEAAATACTSRPSASSSSTRPVRTGSRRWTSTG